MSRRRDAIRHLTWLVTLTAVQSWIEAGGRFAVIGSDGKAHLWTAEQVCAFFAGVCAGRNLRDER